MVWIDYSILAVIALSAIMSFMRGFVREAFSLLSWLTAFFVASQFYMKLAVQLTFLADPMIREITAVLVLFVATLMIGGLINYILGQLVRKTGLSGTDRLLGLGFGSLRGILIVCALLYVAQFFSNNMQAPWWKASQLIPEFILITHWFFEGLAYSKSLWS